MWARIFLSGGGILLQYFLFPRTSSVVALQSHLISCYLMLSRLISFYSAHLQAHDTTHHSSHSTQHTAHSTNHLKYSPSSSYRLYNAVHVIIIFELILPMDLTELESQGPRSRVYFLINHTGEFSQKPCDPMF